MNQATAEGIAKTQVDLITKEIGDTGDIAILSAAANATNQNAWIELMKKDLTANHPNVKLIDTVYGNDDDQTSFDKTSALLAKYPALIDGKITGKEGDSFTAGKLGDFTVGKDGTVVLGDPFTFTKDNIGAFHF